MVTSSKVSDSSSSRSKDKEYVAGISWNLSQLKKQVQASRLIAVREKVLNNRKKLEIHTSDFFELAKEKQEMREPMESENLLSVRLVNPLCRLSACEPDKEIGCSQEEISSSASIVFGSSCGGKSVVRLNKLPFVEKIPPYTTWIFLTRNQRMAEDQSVLGRRQIYYDPYGNETLICSDSEEEIVEPEDEKRDFSEGEDQIMWKAIQEYGLNQEVMHTLCHSIEALPEEIEERYEILLEKYNKNSEREAEVSSVSESKSLLDRTLSAALDSFDNLFCRRCLIFDCRLHGCSQNLITASEKQPYGSDPEETRKPCSKHCYLRMRENEEVRFPTAKNSKQIKTMESASPSESSDSNPDDDITNLTPSNGLCSDVNRLTIVASETVVNIGKRKNLIQENMPLGKSQYSSVKHVGPAEKKQKNLASEFSPPNSEANMLYTNNPSVPDTKCQVGAANCDQLQHESNECPLTNDDRGNEYGTNNKDRDVNKKTEVSLIKSLSSFSREQTCGWSVIEKDLYLKGIEIFGKNRCFISTYAYHFGCY